jgi:hypothetical protein
MMTSRMSGVTGKVCGLPFWLTGRSSLQKKSCRRLQARNSDAFVHQRASARRPVMEEVADKTMDCSLLDRVTITPMSPLCAHSDPSQVDPT